ncbi:MAG: hypothetical protein HFE40_00785 [Clostridia bacterium]|nr:hypothetical protein [Clostridia bacterium]
MNFTAYIERQKSLIRERHEGELFLMEKGEVILLSESEKLFAELSKIKGLNTRERLFFRRAV